MVSSGHCRPGAFIPPGGYGNGERLPGLILLLIAGGRLFYFFSDKWLALVAAQHPGERNERTGAERPPPPPCGRPCCPQEGRQAAGQLPAGSASALCRSSGGGKIVKQAAGHRQVADKQGGAALPVKPAEEAAEGSFAEPGKTMTGAAEPGWRAFL